MMTIDIQFSTSHKNPQHGTKKLCSHLNSSKYSPKRHQRQCKLTLGSAKHSSKPPVVPHPKPKLLDRVLGGRNSVQKMTARYVMRRWRVWPERSWYGVMRAEMRYIKNVLRSVRTFSGWYSDRRRWICTQGPGPNRARTYRSHVYTAVAHGLSRLWVELVRLDLGRVTSILDRLLDLVRGIRAAVGIFAGEKSLFLWPIINQITTDRGEERDFMVIRNTMTRSRS